VPIRVVQIDRVKRLVLMEPRCIGLKKAWVANP
jgi:hypothetical protein